LNDRHTVVTARVLKRGGASGFQTSTQEKTHDAQSLSVLRRQLRGGFQVL
jgi:hypothetical protein